jgi:hypothetical protein
MLVISLALGGLQAPSYHVFPEDWARYQKDFQPFLPTAATSEVAAQDEYEVFLPVSYHMNPQNFPTLETTTQCTSTELDWYGTQPSFNYCGFYGRQCYSDGDWCKAHCASDLFQAFGNHSGHGGDTSTMRVSTYFTWYSKNHNQPILSGFWSSAFDAAESVPHTCDAHPSMCDPSCADSGPPMGRASAASASFGGCGNNRACGMFATCTLGSTTVPNRWADEQPPGANTTLNNEAACEAAGFYWEAAVPAKGYPARCTWTNAPDCKTGRCFDRGHVVPSGAMGQLFGRSGQSFTMCNIAPQTSILNECKWMYVEQAVACVGRYHLSLTLAGSLGPYTPSLRMSTVPRPAYQWKVVFLPGGQPSLVNDTVLVWVFANDEVATYDPKAFCGRPCLERIQKGLGVTFPPRITSAVFPTNATDILTSLVGEKEQAACQISRSTFKKGDNVTYEQLAMWGPWNVIYGQSGRELPTFPCPSSD